MHDFYAGCMTLISKLIQSAARPAPDRSSNGMSIDDRFRRSGDPRIDHANSAWRSR